MCVCARTVDAAELKKIEFARTPHTINTRRAEHNLARFMHFIFLFTVLLLRKNFATKSLAVEALAAACLFFSFSRFVFFAARKQKCVSRLDDNETIQTNLMHGCIHKIATTNSIEHSRLVHKTVRCARTHSYAHTHTSGRMGACIVAV